VCEVLITSRSSSFRGVMFAYYIGLVAHNMYPILAVYQRIFNQIIQIVHWLVDSDLFWAVWWKPRDSTANGWKWRCIKLCAFFSEPLCIWRKVKSESVSIIFFTVVTGQWMWIRSYVYLLIIIAIITSSNSKRMA